MASSDEPGSKGLRKHKKRKSMSDKPATEEHLDEHTEDQANDPELVVNDGDDGDESSRVSKKRKTSVAEIEVDITAPEPPSRKALRALKKGKTLVSTNDSDSKPGIAGNSSNQAGGTETEKRSDHGVWIGNLNWSTSEADLRSFLTGNSEIDDESITRVHMSASKAKAKPEATRPHAKQIHNTGFAYVDFKTAKQVELAIELSEQLLGGRRLLIKNCKSFEGRPEKKAETATDFGGKPPNPRIFVGNLGFDVTEEIITEHLERCGAIQSVKLATFEDSGKCKGYGWVVFNDLESAMSAVKGFVMVSEDDDDDSNEDEEAPSTNHEEVDSESGDKAPSQAKPRPKKTRKVWVNRIKGRQIRMEYAEDAKTRYNKRYGKEGTKAQAQRGNANADADAANDKPAEEPAAHVPLKARKVDYRKDYAPRLTGGIVESKGKKVVF